MIIITSVTSANKNTERMRKSFERFGYEVADSRPKSSGRKDRDQSVYDLIKRAATGHDLMCYSDAADTICQREFELPTDYLLFAAEKQYWPDELPISDYPNTRIKTLWKYLNGGVWGGPSQLHIEFFDRYRSQFPHNNGQYLLHRAFVAAKKDGFPIKLDYKCDLFQCIAHEGINPEFSRGEKGELITNLVTKTTPAIFHGNGLTDMKFIEDRIM